MANTLTNLIPVLYQAIDIVSRELVGLIPAVTMNASAEQAAKDQTITYPIAPASSAVDISPGLYAPDAGDQTIGNDTMTISKSRAVPVRWNGEEIVSVGGLYSNLLRDQFAQAMRTLTNEVESDLAALYAKASRAYGAAGTAPFGTAGDYTDASNVLKILKDNGAPISDLQLVVNTAAGANLRGKQGGKANEAGTDSILRNGVLLDIHGFAVRESAQIKQHTKGTGTGYAVNLVAGYDIGSTSIAIDTGSNTVLAGDVFTNTQSGRDAEKYIVKTALSGGSLVLANPGIRAAWVDGDTVAVGNNYSANLAFNRGAIHLICRTPAMPPGGDMADDVMTITDPVSGLTFQVALYRQYRQIKYEIGLAWGVKCVKPEHLAILLG